MNPGEGRAPPLTPADLGFGKLFGVIADAVIVGDATSGRIVLWNPAAERMFGYSADEAVGMPIEALVPPSLRDAHRDGLTRFARGRETSLVGTGQAVEVPARRKNDSELWVDLTLSPMKTPTIPGRFVLALVRDVTERRRSQERLAATAEELHTANQAMREFLIMAAHDLRTPVTTIIGAAQLISSRDLAAREAAEFSAMIVRQGEHLAEMVRDFADLGHIELGEVKPNPAEVCVADVVNDAVESCRVETRCLAVDLSDSLRVWADRGHLHRILTNYLTNAGKYAAATDTSVRARPAGDSVDIGVIDNGPGVPPDFAPRLFDKFTRSATAGRRAGRGIGLAIVAGLARINGGTVWYEPNRPTGSQFWVRLPAYCNGGGPERGHAG